MNRPSQTQFSFEDLGSSWFPWERPTQWLVSLDVMLFGGLLVGLVVGLYIYKMSPEDDMVSHTR